MSDNISPILWGKSGWIFINSIAKTYKPEYKEKYKLFLEQLGFILPCSNCGENLRKNISNIDDALQTQEKFMTFLLNIRNQINIDNGLPLKTMQDNINEIYENDKHCNNYYIVLYVVIIILLIFIYVLYKNK